MREKNGFLMEPFWAIIWGNNAFSEKKIFQMIRFSTSARIGCVSTCILLFSQPNGLDSDFLWAEKTINTKKKILLETQFSKNRDLFYRKSNVHLDRSLTVASVNIQKNPVRKNNNCSNQSKINATC